MRAFFALVFLLALSITPAVAKTHHHHYHYHHRAVYRSFGFGGSNVAAARAQGLPWCGAEMADEFGFRGAQGRDLWLARNWANIGSATSAHVGAVVVWRHHVGRIVGRENGQWVVHSGNDGGGVRSRPRSLAGVIAIRDVGGASSFVSASAYTPQRVARRRPTFTFTFASTYVGSFFDVAAQPAYPEAVVVTKRRHFRQRYARSNQRGTT